MGRLDFLTIFKSATQMIKIFFHSQKWKKILMFLCFILLSFGLWYLESLQQEYEIEILLSVRYKNVPTDVILSKDNPQNILAKVRDKGTVLINYMWFRPFLPIEIDLKDISRDKIEPYIVSNRIIESSISKQLIATTSLLNTEPSTILVAYEALMHKEIAIYPNVSIQFEPGYQLSGEIVVNPAQVLVYANNVILDTLTTIKTELIELKKAKETVKITVKLINSSHLQIDPEKVELTIPIEEYTEKRLKTEVLCPDLPNNYILRAFPQLIEIICHVPMSRYKELNDDDFEITIPYKELYTSQMTGELSLHLTKQPSWIVNPILNPSSIEFILEQKNL